MSIQPSDTPGDKSPMVVHGELRCALTGKVITMEEAYWAPPLITTRELIGTILVTAVRAPRNLGAILFTEPENVPYATDARDQLARRRSIEQIKLLIILLLIAALIYGALYLINRAW